MILPHNTIVDVAIAIFKAVDEVFQNKTFKIQYMDYSCELSKMGVDCGTWAPYGSQI